MESPHHGQSSRHVGHAPPHHRQRSSHHRNRSQQKAASQSNAETTLAAADSSLKMMTVTVQTEPIPLTEEYLQQLRALVPSLRTLNKKGFTVRPFMHHQLETRKKCQRCNKPVGRHSRPAHSESMNSETHPADDEKPETGKKNGRGRCNYHTGHVRFREWTCCKKPPPTKYCASSQYHLARVYPPGELASIYQVHFLRPLLTHEHRAAVSIDCEMGTSAHGDSELIRVTVVDYFAGTVLVDKLVYPDVEMQHFNTRFSGITRGQMEEARRAGRCLTGKAHARGVLCRFVGPETIVVGHAVHGDLRALRCVHTNVVDTLIIEEKRRKAVRIREELVALREEIEREAKAEEGSQDADSSAVLDADPSSVTTKQMPAAQPTNGGADGNNTARKGRRIKGKPGGVSLKALAADRLGRTIQTGAHDSVEDAMATRDLLHWMITNPPPEGEPCSDDEVEGDDDDVEEWGGLP